MTIKRLSYIFLLFAALNSFAQDITNSPYTRFGIGDIDRNGFNHSKAMGGLATGLRASNQINYLNPAAISAQDTMSFILDLGLSGVSKNLKSSSESTSFNNFAFDHFTISFPIQRWWFFSFGLTPYSKIGYNILQEEDYALIDTVNLFYNYYGNGGINQLFMANSFKIGKNLAIGINTNYLFGSLEQYTQAYLDKADSYSTVVKDKLTLNKLTFDFGLQYFNEINDKYFYVIGISYSNKINFNTTKESSVFMTENFHLANVNVIDYLAYYNSDFDTISTATDHNYKVEIPERYSVGFTAGIKNKLTVGFDYSHQDWSEVKSLNIADNFTLDQTFNVGIEYTPDKFTLRNYLKRINYRAGFYLNNSYIQLQNEQIKNYGITFGLGFPITNQRTSLNVSYTYGKKGTINNGLIEETYSLFGINLTLYDFWFFKRKIQ